MSYVRSTFQTQSSNIWVTIREKLLVITSSFLHYNNHFEGKTRDENKITTYRTVKFVLMACILYCTLQISHILI